MKSNKEQQIIKSELKDAQWIGEDGGMVVNGNLSTLGAWRKMVKLLREECGEIEAQEFIDEVKPEDLGIGWLHLVTEENKKELDFDIETDWYISITNKSPYEVWVYWT